MQRIWIMALILLIGAQAKAPAQEDKPVCGIENCHGIDIVCGFNVPEVCTEIYEIGDLCRPFASCESVDGLCMMRPNPVFENCAACVRACIEEAGSDPLDVFVCEAQCLKGIEQRKPEKVR